MDNKALDALEKALTDAAKKMSGPLSILALLGLASEFYTKEERGQLMSRYHELKKADQDAYAALDAAQKALTESTPAHIDGYAAEQLADVMASREARRETMDAINTFEKEHGLIVELLRFKDTFPGEL
jgi:hypothetical protein